MTTFLMSFLPVYPNTLKQQTIWIDSTFLKFTKCSTVAFSFAVGSIASLFFMALTKHLIMKLKITNRSAPQGYSMVTIKI